MPFSTTYITKNNPDNEPVEAVVKSEPKPSDSTPCKFSYWLRLFIYLGLAICTPCATFLTGLTPETANSMEWYSWTGQILTCLVSAMVTIRAFLDTTTGRQAADKEWEEYLSDVKKDAKEMAGSVSK